MQRVAILSLILLTLSGCSSDDGGSAFCDSCSLSESSFQSCFLDACEFCDIPGGTGLTVGECLISVGRQAEVLACQDQCDGCGADKGCYGCAEGCTGSPSQMRCSGTLASETVSCTDGVFGGAGDCSDTEILPNAAACDQYADEFDCADASYDTATDICTVSGCVCEFVIDDF